jgi:hypothetical protein
MNIRLLATAALTGALSLTMIGTAAAAPLGHPKHHPKPKHQAAVTQITGKELAKALLPASDYGSGYTASGETTTGGKLLSSAGAAKISSLPCTDLGTFEFAFGQTGEAANVIGLPQNASQTSGNLILAVQDISQFANGQTAWSFTQQERSKYNSCTTYGENLPQSGSMTISLESLSGTKIDGYYAFSVEQEADFQDSQGDTLTLYINSTVVNAGTNVYTIWEMNAASQPVASSMLSSLISKTRALYK